LGYIVTDGQTYLADLERALLRGGLDEERTGEVIREMANHLSESGDRPLDTFGDPGAYATALLPAEHPVPEGDQC